MQGSTEVRTTRRGLARGIDAVRGPTLSATIAVMCRSFSSSLIVWLVAAWGCSRASGPQVAPGSGNTQTAGPTVRVYQLDGFYYDRLSQEQDGPFDPPANSLRRWPVLEETLVTDERFAAEFRAAVDDPSNFGGNASDCFWPGMGIAVGDGVDRIDLVICLQCNLANQYKKGNVLEQRPLSERGRQEFARLYTAAFPGQPNPSR